MISNQKYIRFLIEFHAKRDYFECHEIGEEEWKSSTGLEKQTWLFFIKVSVAMYHYRRGNYAGARKTIEKALLIMEEVEENINELGIDYFLLKTALEKVQMDISVENPYQSICLYISDKLLLEKCERICYERDLLWNEPSNMDDENLIHRHSKRDRSNVIKEREKQLEARLERRDT